MQKLYLFSILLLFAATAYSQDDCSFATPLCGSFQASGSTQGATQAINDPGLDCGDNTVNNSVWFTIEGINDVPQLLPFPELITTPDWKWKSTQAVAVLLHLSQGLVPARMVPPEA
ncbi:MAG: hypothetical protein IPQ03_04250 [Bacteroidetes bacterium]|nr:hypothetical protein [Bacteroidota bacterium]